MAAGIFLLQMCNSVSYLSGVLIFTFSAFKSVSICANTLWNFGLEVCMRLLLAKAMLSASLSVSISGCVNLGMSSSIELRGDVPRFCVVANGDCSVKPERQNNSASYPVSPARLDQPRIHYPRKIGRRPMGGL